MTNQIPQTYATLPHGTQIAYRGASYQGPRGGAAAGQVVGLTPGGHTFAAQGGVAGAYGVGAAGQGSAAVDLNSDGTVDYAGSARFAWQASSGGSLTVDTLHHGSKTWGLPPRPQPPV